MPASAANDKFRLATPFFSTTLAVGCTSADTTLNLTSTTNLPTTTACTIIIDEHDSTGAVITPTTKREVIRGEVSGTTLINCVRGVDTTTPQAHSVNAVIEVVPTASDWNDAMNTILVHHNQDGSLKPLTETNIIPTAAIQDSSITTSKLVDANVTTTKIADSNVTTAKIADSNVTTTKIADSNVTSSKIADANITQTKLATNAILLGLAQVTTPGSTTNNSSAPADTGLSLTATVPSGGRAVEVSVHFYEASNSTANCYATFELFDGATQINGHNLCSSTDGASEGVSFSHVYTPSAGSHTWSVKWFQQLGGTARFSASSTIPAQIIAKLI